MTNDKLVSHGNNHFTNKLYTQLSKEKGNVFFSPISAYTALALIQQGAEGHTDVVMCKALGLNTKSDSVDGFQQIMTSLNDVQNVTLEIANKVYVKTGYTMKESFKMVATKSFLSGAENLDFAKNVQAADTINKWVESKTNEKIKNVIPADALNALTNMVLVNAVYFKGDWAEKFDKERTNKEPFYVSATETIECDMMHKLRKYNYKEDSALDAKILQIPYKNKDLSLVILLPNTKDGITALEGKLENYDLSELTNNMANVEVIVSLPRFKVETTMNMEKPLTAIGLGDIFSNSADFSGILESPEQLEVSKVIQKAFIEVNEEGSEAAAATGRLIGGGWSISKEFNADQPFIYILKTQTEILFLGKLQKPN